MVVVVVVSCWPLLLTIVVAICCCCWQRLTNWLRSLMLLSHYECYCNHYDLVHHEATVDDEVRLVVVVVVVIVVGQDCGSCSAYCLLAMFMLMVHYCPIVMVSFIGNK